MQLFLRVFETSAVILTALTEAFRDFPQYVPPGSHTKIPFIPILSNSLPINHPIILRNFGEYERHFTDRIREENSSYLEM
jgi:hypothetical protein